MECRNFLVAIILSLAFKAEGSFLGNAANVLAAQTENPHSPDLESALQSIAELESASGKINATVDCIDDVLQSVGESAKNEKELWSEESSALVEKNLAIVENEKAVIQDLVAELEKCGFNPICITKVTANLTAVIVQIPTKAQTLLLEAVEFLNSAAIRIVSNIAKISADAGQGVLKCLE